MDLHREIEFRGLDRVEKKWRFGCLLVIDGNPHIIESSDISEVGHHFQQEGDRPTWVIPETVGQFTGLTDRKGKKIYEGDIVNAYTLDTGLPIRTGVIEFTEGIFAFSYAHIKIPMNMLSTHLLEVISNVHDKHEIIR